MKLRHNRKKNMKTHTLVTALGAAVITAIAINVTARDVYFSPRAAGNQIRLYSGINNEALPAKANGITYSPRAAGSLIQRTPGTNSGTNPALACVKTMKSSPRAVAECISHATMPGCHPANLATLN